MKKRDAWMQMERFWKRCKTFIDLSQHAANAIIFASYRP